MTQNHGPIPGGNFTVPEVWPDWATTTATTTTTTATVNNITDGIEATPVASFPSVAKPRRRKIATKKDENRRKVLDFLREQEETLYKNPGHKGSPDYLLGFAGIARNFAYIDPTIPSILDQLRGQRDAINLLLKFLDESLVPETEEDVVIETHEGLSQDM